MANSITIPLNVTISLGKIDVEMVYPEPEEVKTEEVKMDFQNKLTNELEEIVDKICDR